MSKRNWNEIPLGKMPDRQIAKEYNIPYGTVSNKRRKLGIESVDKRGKLPDPNLWEKYKSLPLGKVPDSVIAKKLGVTRQRIEQIRKRFNIPSFTEVRKEETEVVLEDLGLLGELSDHEISKLTGIPYNRIQRIRRNKNIKPGYIKSLYTRWDDVDWTMTNGEIAKRLNLCPEVVARARKRYKKPSAIFIPGNKKGIDWDNQPLGKVSDSTLAKKLGCSRASVVSARKTRNISSHKKGKNK